MADFIVCVKHKKSTKSGEADGEIIIAESYPALIAGSPPISVPLIVGESKCPAKVSVPCGALSSMYLHMYYKNNA